jgi:hypothetical protein
MAGIFIIAFILNGIIKNPVILAESIFTKTINLKIKFVKINQKKNTIN